MAAQKSLLSKAGGDIAAAQAAYFDYAARSGNATDRRDAEVTRARLQSADPAERARGQAYLDRKIRLTTKGKYSGVLGAIGKVATKAAPLAALIPGVGIPLAAGIAAAGKLGEGGNLGQVLKAGALSGAGAAALGGQGYKGLGSVFKGGAPSTIGNVTQSGVAGVAGAGGGGIGGIVGRVGGGILDFIKADPERAIKLGLGGIGAIQASKAAGQASDLTRRALAPLFDGSPNPFANIGADPGNPYDDPTRRRTGQRALSMELAR